jgi:hypothetical protein
LHLIRKNHSFFCISAPFVRALWARFELFRLSSRNKNIHAFVVGGRFNGLQNAKKNCILHLSTDRNTGGHNKMQVPDTPYMLALKTASSA